jgi:hypothetical protein
LIITMKDNKTIEIVFLKNESRTMIIFVSESQSQNMSILGRSLPDDTYIYLEILFDSLYIILLIYTHKSWLLCPCFHIQTPTEVLVYMKTKP